MKPAQESQQQHAWCGCELRCYDHKDCHVHCDCPDDPALHVFNEEKVCQNCGWNPAPGLVYEWKDKS